MLFLLYVSTILLLLFFACKYDTSVVSAVSTSVVSAVSTSVVSAVCEYETSVVSAVSKYDTSVVSVVCKYKCCLCCVRVLFLVYGSARDSTT